MIGNLFSKLPGLSDHAGGGTVDVESDEFEAKRERIDFHRRQVRNGPTSFKYQTAGQVKRARHRALRRDTKRARRGQVRRFLVSQREIAVLRGQLQAVGVLPYAQDGQFTPADDLRWNALLAILGNFGDADAEYPNDRETLVAAIERAFNRWQALTGRETTPLSPAYALPLIDAA